MATATSLTLRALFSRAGAVFDAGRLPAVTAGLTPPAQALAAVLAARAERGVTLLVVPTDKHVEQVVSDARFFHGALEGASGAAVEQAVLPYPSHQVDPYRGMTPHFRVSAARARALYGAVAGTTRLIVASASALLPRVSPPERLLVASREIRIGTEVEPQALADLLVDAGYTREDPVDEHGSFAIRGGIVDLFLAADAEPVRIEFVGDMVESIRRFDPATQRSTVAVDQVTIVPVRERFDGADLDPARDAWALDDPAAHPPAAGDRDAGWDADEDEALWAVPDDPREARAAGAAPVRGRVQPAPAGERREAPSIGPGDVPELVSVLDFLASATRLQLIVCEYEQVQALAERQREHLETSHADAASRGHVTALPPAVAFAGWPDLERRAAAAPRLEELAMDEPGTPGTDDAEATRASRRVSVRHVRCQPAMAYHGRVGEWIAAIREARGRGDTVLFVAASAGRAERTIEILHDYEIVALPVEGAEDAHAAAVLVAGGHLSRGFRLVDAGLQVFAETDVFDEERRAPESPRQLAKTFLSDLRDLKTGDLVVHVDHGIGEFVGLKQLQTGRGAPGAASVPGTQEFLELRYHGEDKLFVPVERLDLIQKYTGGTRPALDRLGGTTWEKAKSRVKKAMRDMAEELLKLYAQRKAVSGHAFAPDTHWQEEFEGGFPYELTPDQATAITAIKRDMESTQPMDRLLCGDVGYGKTEVAMRAAFKAVMDGKQVAVLAPTTVLAFQHLKTLRDRFAGFPVTVEMVSRFRTRQEVKEALAALATGKVDIIVGTHRLLSKDVQFKDLGLLVVDEEQRFGVAHKERIKQIRRRVDVLTMTATPIPRTLNMSLVGIRDMSIIETPPKDRLSIQTNVVRFDAPVIERAVRNELARGGQVYFVHNRVESIFSIGHLLQRLVPEARVAVAHGQMGEDELERAMLGFVGRQYDILLATTIVENGLDIPNANTMIINRADRYGLAQLYQLRGRVGRSDRPAYAYLLVPPQDSLSPIARRRLAAIREFSDLGSGFRVAALDLEIRGAGNLLGGEQSGHIDAVGFEMYMKLLEETIRELKGEAIDDDLRATVTLGVDVRIGDDYIPDMNQRLMVYRKVAAARTFDEIAGAVEDVRDRYGPPPPAVLNLAAHGRIRVMADRLGVESIDREKRLVVIRFRASAPVDPVRLVTVVTRQAGAVLVPPVTLRLDLDATTAPPVRPPPGRGGGARAGRRGSPAPSWWTARATAGEVTAGFTREEILRQPDADPRAPGGLFDRLEGLLGALGADVL